MKTPALSDAVTFHASADLPARPAFISRIYSDREVGLTVIDLVGQPFTAERVYLLQEGEAAPEARWCEY